MHAFFQDESIVNGHTRLILGCFLTTLAAGCDEAPPTGAPPAVPSTLADGFDPETAGSITGRVFWKGDVPLVPVFRAPDNPNGEAAIGPRHERSNPNAPVIDESSHGVAGAVIFLRSVDPQRSRPWDLSSVRVEMRDFDYRVHQGDAVARTGFVRRGETVEFVSRQSVFHSLRARGDAFFTLAFPDADQPREHTFHRPGVVELSSATGFFWARAYLFVVEHPYYVRTDREGRYALPQVPPGEYELVCWLPSWREKERELDSDSWQVSRLTFRPPVEVKKKVRVIPRETTEVGFTLSMAKF
jgi:hypothetical protein